MPLHDSPELPMPTLARQRGATIIPVYVYSEREGNPRGTRGTKAFRCPCPYCTWQKAFPTVAQARAAEAEHERATHGHPLH